MARIYYNGFESGNIGRLFTRNCNLGGSTDPYQIVSDADIPSLAGYENHEPMRYGSYALALSSTHGVQFFPADILGTDPTEIFVSFKYQQISGGYHSNPWFSITNYLGNTHFDIEDDTWGHGGHKLTIGPNQVVYPSFVFQPYRWQLVELWYKLSTTSGTYDGEYEIRINGRTYYSATNYRTSNSGIAAACVISAVNFTSQFGAGSDYILLDDFVFDTTSSFDISNSGVVRFEPVADQTTGWTPSTGSTIYEITDNKAWMRDMPDQEYVSTDTTSEVSVDIGIDSTTVLSSDSTIYSVQTDARVSKVGVPSINNVKSFLDISGTKYYGDLHTVPIVNFYSYTDIWETNPDTLTYWTNTDLDNLIIGVKGD